ncbi:glycosyltransferase [Laribacter hongkongensis]|uniref:glycosyltransferase n=1 Tax=Laribacter hongkongensis TaxID=168471 RepID=UPI001EFCF26E|nr:glycosyltransferase [Laribacter hongkongensis]MCG9059537.1 glycosyltransferase [Laribacter hongkongensis]MCG9086575.1 glycosyltransferase [Laribacter hongkongensis]
MKLFLHAPNIHHGGGAVLLNDLMRAIPADLPAIATLDERMVGALDLPARVGIRRVRSSVCGRFSAERWLSRQVEETDRVLCFGNLPPLFKLRCDVSVFLQNRYLVDDQAPLSALPLKPRIRLRMEWVWLRLCLSHANRYFVQTPSMQRLAEDRLGVSAMCSPFVPESVLSSAATSAKTSSSRFDFLYVASGEAHKNHATLISAWAMLADEGVFPSLALTLSETTVPDLAKHIEVECAAKGLNIVNLGVLPHDQLVDLYRDSKALIYPSGFESFGLPLIEAKLAGLSILAPELDYVRDVVDPTESFDPHSPISIARAVKRFLKKEQSTFKPMSAENFLNHLLSGA